MQPQSVANNQTRGAGSVPPPGGASFASFVLFASLATLLAFIYLGGEWLGLGGQFGFPTDAAWVRAALARGVASGHGLGLTAGAPVAGAAAPSWIVALGLAALPTGNYIIAAKALGVLAVILSAFLAWAITLRLLQDWRFAFLAGLLVITSPLLSEQALSGTEGAFAGLLILVVIYWWGLGWEGERRSRVVGAIALGLAALTRPELILLFPLALVDRWLVAGIHGRRGDRLQDGLARSFPEVLGAASLAVIYMLYNLYAGGPLWQQPEAAVRAQPALAWVKLTLSALWASNPVVLCAVLPGLFVATLASARARAQDPTFLPTLIPVTLLLLPGLFWRQIANSNATYAATYLVPLVSILGVAGLYLLYRLAQRRFSRPVRAARLCFGLAVGMVLCAVFGPPLLLHQIAWNQHKEQVTQEFDLNVCLGKRAAQLLASDASIATREVGAISFFSNRRVIDLGGNVSSEGIRALRSGSTPDAGLLTYLEEVKPSHLAIQPGQFQYLTQRPRLLRMVKPFTHTNKLTGGTSTLVLYETPWTPPSLRALSRAPE